MVYGYVIIDLSEKKIYTQWSLEHNADWSKGEDIVINIDPDNEKEIKQMLRGVRIKDVEVYTSSIWLWCVSNE